MCGCLVNEPTNERMNEGKTGKEKNEREKEKRGKRGEKTRFDAKKGNEMLSSVFQTEDATVRRASEIQGTKWSGGGGGGRGGIRVQGT